MGLIAGIINGIFLRCYGHIPCLRATIYRTRYVHPNETVLSCSISYYFCSVTCESLCGLDGSKKQETIRMSSLDKDKLR